MMAGEDSELIGKYGHPLAYDSNFRGPLWRRRSCTDVPCLLIFLLFLGGWVFIAQYAIRNGDLNKLMIPTDSMNHKCGLDSEVLDKKYLFYFNLEKCIDPLVPITGCPTPQVCVKTCPTQTFVWDTMKNRLSLEELKQRLICITEKERISINSKEDAELATNSNRCARWYIKSAPFLNRCMWEFSPEVCDYIPSSLLQRNSRQVLEASFNQSFVGQMEPQLQAMALTLSTSERRIAEPDSKSELMEEPIVQCRRRTQLDETVIKEKMMKTDTKLAKLVGNLVAHFYNGTHSAQNLGEEIAEDILNSWHVILVASVCTLVASLVLIALMRWLAAPFVWFSILGVLVSLIVGVYYCIKEHIYYKQIALESNLKESNVFLIASIILAISFVVILISVILMRKRIKIAIALIKEGSKAVSSVTSTVFFPIFSWTLFIAVIMISVAVALYLGSIGEPAFRMVRQLDPKVKQTKTILKSLGHHSIVATEKCICEGQAQNYTLGAACEPSIFHDNCYNPPVTAAGDNFFNELTREPCTRASCVFLDLEHPALIKWFMAYNTFGFFWLVFFIAAFSEMVLAAAFATWYWTFKKRDVPFFTLSRAFGQTVFYHLGTLAFGSLIITICRMIRIMLEFANQHLKNSNNAAARLILYCMKYLFLLLESFLRFINGNAYIMCAIHGKNFCGSAQDAFNLLMRNFLRVVTLDAVTDFLFLLCKVVVTGTVGGSTYWFLATDPPNIQLNHIAVPLTIVVVTFLMTSVFFSVYSMAVDTLFLCFLEDCERNDGSPEKPFYMSKELMKILGKRNKVPDRFQGYLDRPIL